MYVSMYVRVSLYFIDMKLDIALIHHLPKLEKRTRLGPTSDKVEQEKEKRNLWSRQDYNIQHRNHGDGLSLSSDARTKLSWLLNGLEAPEEMEM